MNMESHTHHQSFSMEPQHESHEDLLFRTVSLKNSACPLPIAIQHFISWSRFWRSTLRKSLKKIQKGDPDSPPPPKKKTPKTDLPNNIQYLKSGTVPKSWFSWLLLHMDPPLSYLLVSVSHPSISTLNSLPTGLRRSGLNQYRRGLHRGVSDPFPDTAVWCRGFLRWELGVEWKNFNLWKRIATVELWNFGICLKW